VGFLVRGILTSYCCGAVVFGLVYGDEDGGLVEEETLKERFGVKRCTINLVEKNICHYVIG
jgi:hypothetical protein